MEIASRISLEYQPWRFSFFRYSELE